MKPVVAVLVDLVLARPRLELIDNGDALALTLDVPV